MEPPKEDEKEANKEEKDEETEEVKERKERKRRRLRKPRKLNKEKSSDLATIPFLWYYLPVNKAFFPMLPQDKVLMLVRIPQEIEKRVLAFEQLLVNIHEILHHHVFTFEVTSYNQHIYFFVSIERNLKELIEGQIYAQYPFSEIEEVTDYVKPDVLKRFCRYRMELLRSDIIPIKTFKEFESDSLSGIFRL